MVIFKRVKDITEHCDLERTLSRLFYIIINHKVAGRVEQQCVTKVDRYKQIKACDLSKAVKSFVYCNKYVDS